LDLLLHDHEEEKVVQEKVECVGFGLNSFFTTFSILDKIKEIIEKNFFGINKTSETEKEEEKTKKELEEQKKQIDELKKKAELDKLQDCSKLTGVSKSNCEVKNTEILKKSNSDIPGLNKNDGSGTMSKDANFPQGNSSNIGNPSINQNIPPTPGNDNYVADGNWAPAGCGMPQAPMAYEIGSTGSCAAGKVETVFTGFMKKVKGNYAGGYINSCVQKCDGDCDQRFASTINSFFSQAPMGCRAGYGEKQYGDYSPGSQGAAYINTQITYWKEQALKQKSQCIVVDIDNCDSIGWANYKNILNLVHEKNQTGGRVMVFAKNPQLCGGQEAFNHPVVVGAFVEEISGGELQKLFTQRGQHTNKPILLAVGSGGGNSNNRLTKLGNTCMASKNQKNVFASYDQGSEYQCVNRAVACGN
jgi:hypothetical protein